MNDEILYRYLRGDAEREEVLRVEAWQRASQDNQRVLDELALLLESIPTPTFDQPNLPDVSTLVREAEARRQAASVVPLEPNQRRRRVRQRHVFAAAAAAIVVAAVGLSWAFQLRHDVVPAPGIVEEFITARDERATVRLVDGTVVRLAPRSTLRIAEWTAAQRRVTLDGRAYFAVAHHPHRPFAIATRAGDIRVLGTRFEVHTKQTAMRVVVVQGEVALSALDGADVQLKGNEIGHVVSGVTSVEKQEDAARMIDWIGRFLVLQETPLVDVLTEIEHVYGIRTKLINPELDDQTVTALFVDQPLEDVLETLSLILDMRWVRQGDVVHVEL